MYPTTLLFIHANSADIPFITVASSVRTRRQTIKEPNDTGGPTLNGKSDMRGQQTEPATVPSYYD